MGWSDSWSAVSLAKRALVLGVWSLWACSLLSTSYPGSEDSHQGALQGHRQPPEPACCAGCPQPPELKQSGLRIGALSAQAAPNPCLAQLLLGLIFGFVFQY